MTTADTGTVANGATVTTGIAIMNGVKTAGGNTITAITVAGISVRLTNAATAKAGKIVTTAVAAGVTEKAEATVTAITINNKKEPSGSFFFYRPAAVPISNHKFNATTTTTMAHPARFTHVEFTRSPISDLLLVKISSGTSASAIPKLSST